MDRGKGFFLTEMWRLSFNLQREIGKGCRRHLMKLVKVNKKKVREEVL